MSEKDKSELIGCIIDIFEDDLHNRSLGKHSKFDKWEAIPLHFEDEDCDGVFYGGEVYDNIASKLETLLKECKLI